MSHKKIYDQAINRFYSQGYAPIARSFYPTGEAATACIQEVQSLLLKKANAPQGFCVVFWPHSGMSQIWAKKNGLQQAEQQTFTQLFAGQEVIIPNTIYIIPASSLGISCPLEIMLADEKVINASQPLLYGGGMVQSASYQKTTFLMGHKRLAAGSPPAAQIIGLYEVVKSLK